MADYIEYGENTVGGKQVAESFAMLRATAEKFKGTGNWINAIGPAGLETNAAFMVQSTKGQAFNDTYLQVVAALDTLMTTFSANIARLARGS